MSRPNDIQGILGDLIQERWRQDKKHGADRQLSPPSRLAILAEEFGEVAKEVNEFMHGCGNKVRLREELVQTAASAIAWIEQLDNFGGHRLTGPTPTPPLGD
jgi:NTP pyrophosphatase (non-canonical NTP hydrolase)